MRRLTALFLWLACGCLPTELRDPPAEVFVTVEPSAATRDGFETSSGWHITFDRVLLNIGRVGFEDDDNCSFYSFTQYSWLIEMTEAEREKVGLAYALGDCGLRFDLPAVDPRATRLGVGADEEAQRALAYDVSTWIEGKGRRGSAEEIPFELGLGYLAFGPCLRGPDATTPATTGLTSGGVAEVPLLASPEAFFAPVMAPDEPNLDLAEADLDGDGRVDSEELVQAIIATNGFEVSIGSFQLTQMGQFVRLRDGGPCPLADPDDRGFGPF